MTNTNTARPNAVDYLKHVLAETEALLSAAHDYLSGETDIPAEVAERLESTVGSRLDAVRRIVTEAAAAFARDGRDLNTYSDGRPVVTAFEYEKGNRLEYVWHPYVEHRDNRPRELFTVETTSGKRRRLLIAAPGVLDAVDATDESDAGADK